MLTNSKPDPVRSDCHAWSASPDYYFISIVAGITPSAPGFKKVKISPSFGKLNYVLAAIPHLSGTLKVDLTKIKQKGIRDSILLPPGLSGTFVWNSDIIELHEGL